MPAARHILIAEDEALIAYLLQDILEVEGYRVSVAPDSVAVARVDAADPIDLLLSDIRMPRWDGLALAAELRGRRPALPVILMTGHMDVRTIPPPPGGGPTRLFAKPVPAEELLAAIGTSLSDTA